MIPSSIEERTAIIETKVTRVESDIISIDRKIESKLGELNEKLDSLLAMKNRSVGAFWLASMLFGTSVVGVITALLNWWKGLS